MQEIHVVGAAIIKDGKILAAQRSHEMKSSLKWEFAGGKVEANETHQQALEREIQEELGISIKVHDHIATGCSEADGRKIVLHVYEAELLDGIPHAREHSQVKWIDAGGIENMDWAEADIPACKELIRKYKKNP